MITGIYPADASPTLAYSITGLAKALGISRPTLYNEINSGRIATFKLGGRRLVSVASAQAYIAAAEAAEAGRRA
jgi:excisionase family DNA binding protein